MKEMKELSEMTDEELVGKVVWPSVSEPQGMYLENKAELFDRLANGRAAEQKVKELAQKVFILKSNENKFPTLAEFSNLQDDYETCQRRTKELEAEVKRLNRSLDENLDISRDLIVERDSLKQQAEAGRKAVEVVDAIKTIMCFMTDDEEKLIGIASELRVYDFEHSLTAEEDGK